MSKILPFDKLSQFLLCSFILSILACGGTKKAKLQKIPNYQQLIESSPLFEKSFTGFVLFDPTKEQVLYSKHADRYFNPASNTKIFTLYTALQILGDSIPAIRYFERGDSLIFWGTGYPSLAHPYLNKEDRVLEFLKTSQQQLYFCSGNFKDRAFGSGWAWDDYPYAFQAEKAGFPFHGNIIRVKKSASDQELQVAPSYFSSSLLANNKISSSRLQRMQTFNIFEYNEAILKKPYDRDHPFVYSEDLAIELLAAATGKEIEILSEPIIDPVEPQVLHSVAVDTLYRWMMQESDNFIAEQLLLLCSESQYQEMNTKQIIQFAKDSIFQNSPDELLWNDGSGLSRYNLFTPRTIVQVLHQLQKEIPPKRLFHIFPAGGVSGTIKDWYGNAPTPYIFAKTGTLSNNHCLSGYLVSARGKTLIFSFMHNNYKGSSALYKREMERVLWDIYLNN